MPETYQHIYWLVQENNISREDYDRLKQACADTGIGFEPIYVIPFTDSLPAFNRERNYIVYGSITLSVLGVKDSLLKKGIFYNDRDFSIDNYLLKWGKHMLNYGARITTLSELSKEDHDDESLHFIRPDHDNKSFAGEVKKFADIRQWVTELEAADRKDLSQEEKIVVAKPWNIQSEWRCWIVNKKVVTASRYREQFRLCKETGCPPEVTAFAESRCSAYTPHDVFVMDICLCGNEYYIVECGSMNAAGFYHADLHRLVKAVTDYFAAQL